MIIYSLVEIKKLNVTRFVATVYGEYKALVGNNTTENIRINIVIVSMERERNNG